MSAVLSHITPGVASHDATQPTQQGSHPAPHPAPHPASNIASNAAPAASSTAPLTDRLHQQLWRADQIGSATVAAHPSRFPALDSQLPGGGWPLGMLTELIARNPGVGELRLLVPMLRQLT